MNSSNGLILPRHKAEQVEPDPLLMTPQAVLLERSRVRVLEMKARRESITASYEFRKQNPRDSAIVLKALDNAIAYEEKVIEWLNGTLIIK